MPRVTLPFFGTVSAGSELTLVSKRLSFKYTIKRFVVSFPLGTNRTLQVRFILSQEATAPSSGRPTGLDLLSLYGQVSYLVGDDDQKDLNHEIPVKEAGTYIKAYGNNTDSFDHTLDVQVTIEY